MVCEQGLHGERVQPLIGLGIAAMRLGQEPRTGLGDVLLGECGVHDAIGEDAPGGVEVAREHGEAAHGPVELRLDDRDRARTSQRATGFVARKLLRAVRRRAQQQRLDAGGPLGELAGAAEQVEAHRDDVVRLGRTLDHPDAGHHVRRGGGVRGPAGPAAMQGVGAAPRRDQQAEGEGPTGAARRHGAHGARFTPRRNAAATCSVVSGGASTPITRGRPTM